MASKTPYKISKEFEEMIEKYVELISTRLLDQPIESFDW